MATPDPPLPAATLTREALARIEVGSTNVSRRVARALIASFLVAIGSVPLLEWTGARGTSGDAGPTAWSHLSRLPGDILERRRSDPARASAGAWTQLVAANRQVLGGLSAFERALDDLSLLGGALRRPAQSLMTGVLGAGNERVYPGRGGWLFYRPDVEYITGEGFLDAASLRRRTAAAAEWDAPPQPDPRPAILQFARELEGRGIALVVMPTPVKPGVHPEALSARYATVRQVLHNKSYETFVTDIGGGGVLVFDPSRALARSSAAGAQYLMTDTHWRPEVMEMVAELLAAFIETHVSLPAADRAEYRVERAEVRNLGDTARMLDLPDGSDQFPPETVSLRRVLLPDGSLWRSSRGADVLLLGDSFSNIYSLESMGWGTSAGLAEQLSQTLQRPLDRLVQNDEAAFATRALLQQDPGRLDGVRVVVYQFAARELAFGDWRVLPLGPGGQ